MVLHATKGIEPRTHKRMSQLLMEETCALQIGVASGPNIAWEMDYSRLNFLRPIFVIEPVISSTLQHIETLGKLSTALGEAGWEDAQQAVERLLERKKTSVGLLEKIAAGSAEAKADPPQRNGSSASRW